MRRYFILLFSFFIIVLISCTKEKKSVVYLYPGIKRTRFVKEGNFIVEKLTQLGANAKIVDANDDESVQIAQGMKLVDEGVDMLIIVPVNSITIAPLVRYAQEKGVKVIAYNRLINNVDYDFFVTGDNNNIAEIFCNTAIAQKPTGNYVVLAGDRFDRNGIEIKHAVDSILKPHVEKGSIKIVYESYIESWAREAAVYEMEQVLNSWGTDIDAVITSGDQMAGGVIELLKKHGIEGTMVITGQNGEKEAVENIINGYQTVTIYHPYKLLGYKTAEIAMALLEGTSARELANANSFNGTHSIPTQKIKSIAITKNNFEKELIETGVYKMSDLN